MIRDGFTVADFEDTYEKALYFPLPTRKAINYMAPHYYNGTFN